MKINKLLLASLIMSSSTVNADPYVGGKLSYGWLNDACETSASCDDDSIGAGLYAGYDFSEYLALELGYDYLGDYETNFKNSGTTAVIDDKMHAFTLAPKLTLPLTDKIALFGKLGVAHVSYDSADDEVLTGGLGAEFALNDAMFIRAEYQHYSNIDDGPVDDMDANTISIGFTYKFGQSAAPVAAAVQSEPEPMVAEPAPEVVEEKVEEAVAVVPAPHEATITTVTQKFDSGLFAVNSYELTPAAESVFDDMLNLLLTHSHAKADIIGYTDTSGNKEKNQVLSENRAKSIADYFISKGVKADQLTYRGEGENNPIASNETLTGRKQNRRVEITVPSFEF
jgi:OOP family OmpA-OmpF porin